MPVLVDGQANPEGARFDATVTPTVPRTAGRASPPAARRRGRRAQPGATCCPCSTSCSAATAADEAATTCLQAGLRLTTTDERLRIRAIVDEHVDEGSAPPILAVLASISSWPRWRRALAPPTMPAWCPFKEAVERCFVQGLVKAVFATETFGAGHQLCRPVRSMIEKLTKFTGERRF
ncbi:MAG: hypothetical protein R2755_10720 [Acidimicrobiales bacterium]